MRMPRPRVGIFGDAAERAPDKTTFARRGFLVEQSVIDCALQVRLQGGCTADETIAGLPEREGDPALTPILELLLFAADLSPTSDRKKFQYISHAPIENR